MSDDIPVGSPPAPPGRHAAPGGWYADPARAGQERYWDGWQWTRNVRPAESVQAPAGAHPPTGHTYAPAQPGQQPYAGPQQAYPRGQHPHPGPGWRAVPSTSDGVPLASWGARVGAAILDGIILNVLTAVLAMLTPVGEGLTRIGRDYMAYLNELATTGGTPDNARIEQMLASPAVMQAMALTVVTYVAYHAVLVGLRGASLGKLALGLRVVREGHGGERTPGWRVAVLRPVVVQVMGMVPYVSFLLVVLDALFPLWDQKRQTLHDKVARTQVVTTR